MRGYIMNEVCKVDFHGNEITAVVVDGKQYVAMKPIAEAIRRGFTPDRIAARHHRQGLSQKR
ncbi:MAG: hypothetical protein EOM73_14840 [Bacteroidia bacterium]|nr:hypothetical protein [Bacteroidia bacterium]